MTEEKKLNTFAQMEEQNNKSIPEENVTPHVQGQISPPGELDINAFSDIAVGDRVKYVRPNNEGKIDVIANFQVFPPDTTQEPKTTEKGDKCYWNATMILHWESKNEDGVQNKEYISGAKVWRNNDGQPGKNINFWYPDGASFENQSCILWEKVADCLGIQPENMSPKQFYAFLNSRPKFKVMGLKVKNFKASPGAPKHILKNFPGEYIKG